MRRLAFLALGALTVLLGGIAYTSLSPTTSYPFPVANITVSLPQSPSYKQLTFGTWNDRWPSWSPDGKSIAYVSDRGGLDSVWVMDASGLHARQISSTSMLVTHLTWSPDSSRIAFWSLDGQVAEFRAVDVSNGDSYSVPGSAPNAIQGRAEWSPDGRRLLFLERGTSPVLVIADIGSGTWVPVANPSGEAPMAAWLSDGSVLYTAMLGNASYICEMNLSTSNTSIFAGDGYWNFTSPAVASDGSVAYYSNWLPDIYPSYMLFGIGYDVWFNRPGNATGTWQFKMVPETARGSPLVPVPFLPGTVDIGEPVAWNSNATRIAYSSTSPATGYHLYVWDVVNLTISSVGPSLGTICDAFEPTWSSDGLSIAFSCSIGGFYHILVTSATGVGTAISSGGY